MYWTLFWPVLLQCWCWQALRELYDYVNGVPCSKSTLATQIALQPNGRLIFVPIKQINKILNYLIKIYPHHNCEQTMCAHHQLYGFPTLFPSPLHFHFFIASRSLPFPSTTRSRQLQRNPIPSLAPSQPLADKRVSLRAAEHPLPASLPTCSSPCPLSYAWMHPTRLQTPMHLQAPTRLQTPRAIEHHAPPHLLYHQSHIHSPIMCCISVCLYS